MLRIFLIRHGQTAFNLRNIVQGGGVDSDLNEEGRRQSRLFFDAYRHILFDGVFVSGLKRTEQTLEPFSRLGYQLNAMPELNELNWGEIEGKEATEEVQLKFQQMNNSWSQGHTHLAIEGGESPEVAWARAASGLDKIANMYPTGNVLVCTHGRLIRIILSEALGYGLSRMNMFPHENTALNIIRRTTTGKYIAERLNDQAHLVIE